MQIGISVTDACTAVFNDPNVAIEFLKVMAKTITPEAFIAYIGVHAPEVKAAAELFMTACTGHAI